MKPRRTPRDWQRLVLRHPGISDATRVLLLLLVEHMRTDLSVSVPRKDLARWLDRSEKRITERIRCAHEAGLLDTVSPGRKGHTAVYAAQFPEAHRGTANGTLNGTDSGTVSRALRVSAKRDPMSRHSETPGGPTSSKRPPTSYAVGEVPDETRIFGEPGQLPDLDESEVEHLPNEAVKKSHRRTA